MRRFGGLGLKVYITEFDVDMTNTLGSEAQKRQIQARIYQDMLSACIESKVCNSFTTFGFTDKASWYLLFGKTEAKPLEFDENLQPKSAYFGLQSVLTDLNKSH